MQNKIIKSFLFGLLGFINLNQTVLATRKAKSDIKESPIVPACTFPRHIPQLRFYANKALSGQNLDEVIDNHNNTHPENRFPWSFFIFTKKRAEDCAKADTTKKTHTLLNHVFQSEDQDLASYTFNRLDESYFQDDWRGYNTKIESIAGQCQRPSSVAMLCSVIYHLAQATKDTTDPKKEIFRYRLQEIADKLAGKPIHPLIFIALQETYPAGNYLTQVYNHAHKAARTPLHICAITGTGKEVLDFLSDEQNKTLIHQTDRYKMTPLELAAFYNNIKTVKALLNAGAQITSLKYAVLGGNTEIVDLFLKHIASYSGKDKRLKKLKEAGVDEEVWQAANNERPLHWAIKNSDYDMVWHLLKHHPAKPNLKKFDRQGKSRKKTEPIIYAAEEKDSRILKALLRFGASVDDESFNGSKPLDRAIACGNFEAIHILLEAGANVHAINSCGMSALDYAIEHRQLDMVKFLIEGEKVDLNPQKARFTALDRAIRKKYPKHFIDYLREHGAKRSEIVANKPSASSYQAANLYFNGMSALSPQPINPPLLKAQPGHEQKNLNALQEEENIVMTNYPHQYVSTGDPIEYAEKPIAPEVKTLSPLKHPLDDYFLTSFEEEQLVKKPCLYNCFDKEEYYYTLPPLQGNAKKTSCDSFDESFSSSSAYEELSSKKTCSHHHFDEEKNLPLTVQEKRAFYRQEIDTALDKHDYISLKSLLNEGVSLTELYAPEENPLLKVLQNLKEVSFSKKCPVFLKKKNDLMRISELLIESCNKTAINEPDNNGKTPLLLAIEIGNASLVRTLLDQGAIINGPSQAGMDPLSVAERMFNEKTDITEDRETIYNLLQEAFNKELSTH